MFMSCSNTTSIVTCSSFASVLLFFFSNDIYYVFSVSSTFLTIFNGLLISLYHEAKATQVIFNHWHLLKCIHIESHVGSHFACPGHILHKNLNEI